MGTEVVKSSLVPLDINFDDSDFDKFEPVLAHVNDYILRLGKWAEAVFTSISALVKETAIELDKLYWTSQQTGASASDIQAVSYAASQTGGSIEKMQVSLEGVVSFLNTSTTNEGFINQLGVQTRDANGQIRSLSDIFSDLSQQLSSMPSDQAQQYARKMGIDADTLQAMRSGLSQFTGEYSSMAKTIGFNADTAAVSSNRFMTSFRSFSELMDLLQNKVGSRLADGLSGPLDRLITSILDNFPKVESTLNKGIDGILWLADVASLVIDRLIKGVSDIIGWWDSLDTGTQNLVAAFGSIVVAWRVLNSAFMASPVGMIIALAGALLVLWEDYKTWQEGGESLIDWGKWKPGIDLAIKAMSLLRDGIKFVGNAVAKLLNIDLKNWSLKGEIENLLKQFGEFGKMMSMIGKLINALKDGDWKSVSSIGKQLLTQGQDQPDALSEVTKSAQATRGYLIKQYFKANDILNQYLPEVLGGAPAAQSSQSKNELKLQNHVREIFELTENTLNQIDSGQYLPVQAEEIESTSGHHDRNTRGIRNNNPGNLKYAGQRGGSLEGPGKTFARFDTAFDGLNAMGRQLERYYDGKTTGHPLRSLNKIINAWAPPKENNTEAYVNSLSNMLHVQPDAILNLQDPDTLGQLMSGIIYHENGRNPYSSELIMSAAQNAVTPSINQTTTIHVNGVESPSETAYMVAERQNSVNAASVQLYNTGPR